MTDSWKPTACILCECNCGIEVELGGDDGQGNHLPAGYAGATRHALGSIYRSNALAQEKTGEYWVNERMFGTPWHKSVPARIEPLAAG